jgi:hypothetical protein
MSLSTCGVDNHPDECLCDVVITTPVAITIGDGVDGMWMGRQLCNTRGYALPWTPATILNYFEDLCVFYDRWSELQGQKYVHESQPHERMVQLLRQGVKNSEIIRIIRSEYGVEYTRSAVSKTKSRIGLMSTSDV